MRCRTKIYVLKQSYPDSCIYIASTWDCRLYLYVVKNKQKISFFSRKKCVHISFQWIFLSFHLIRRDCLKLKV